jgi:hypothetical protein
LRGTRAPYNFLVPSNKSDSSHKSESLLLVFSGRRAATAKMKVQTILSSPIATSAPRLLRLFSFSTNMEKQENETNRRSKIPLLPSNAQNETTVGNIFRSDVRRASIEVRLTGARIIPYPFIQPHLFLFLSSSSCPSFTTFSHSVITTYCCYYYYYYFLH